VFKVEPTVRGSDEMKPTHVANRAVMEQLLDMPEMQTLRQHSTGDVYGSALAMVAMQETAVETLKRVHSAAEEAAKAEEERQQERETAPARDRRPDRRSAGEPATGATATGRPRS